jgi:hypothetical protein
MSYLRFLCLFTYSGVQHILCCVFVFLRLVYTMLPVSLDCQDEGAIKHGQSRETGNIVYTRRRGNQK